MKKPATPNTIKSSKDVFEQFRKAALEKEQRQKAMRVHQAERKPPQSSWYIPESSCWNWSSVWRSSVWHLAWYMVFILLKKNNIMIMIVIMNKSVKPVTCELRSWKFSRRMGDSDGGRALQCEPQKLNVAVSFSISKHYTALEDNTGFLHWFYSKFQLTGTFAGRNESAASPAGQLLRRRGAALLQSDGRTAGALVAYKFPPRRRPLSGDPGERGRPAEGAGAPPQAGCEFNVHILSWGWVPIMTSWPPTLDWFFLPDVCHRHIHAAGHHDLVWDEPGLRNATLWAKMNWLLLRNDRIKGGLKKLMY